MASFYERVRIVRMKLMVTVTWTSNYYYNRSNRCDHVFLVEWNFVAGKCVNFNKSTRTHKHSSITEQTNNTVFTSNASGIFSFAPTHFSVIVARPSGLILIHTLLPFLSTCVCISMYVWFFCSSFGQPLTDCSPQ